MKRQVHLDYDKIHLTAQKGILRAAVFLGLGVNASEESNLRDYHLSSHTTFRILPEVVAPEVVDGWKREFRLWIVGCGFRELVDRLCVFLDRIHHATSIVAKDYSAKAQSEFEWLGLDKKIAKLSQKYGIGYRFGDQLASFYPVRNCFAHRLGRVGPEDVKGAKSLDLRFMRFVTVLASARGEEVALPDLMDPSSTPFTIPEDGDLALKWTEERLSYPVGEWIRLSPKVLTEILFFSDLSAKAFTKAAVEFAKKNGVAFKEKKKEA
jgi:hypothetical protein